VERRETENKVDVIECEEDGDVKDIEMGRREKLGKKPLKMETYSVRRGKPLYSSLVSQSFQVVSERTVRLFRLSHAHQRLCGVRIMSELGIIWPLGYYTTTTGKKLSNSSFEFIRSE